MRLFGSDRIANLMDRMGLKEGEVIQHSMVTKSIERAQKKIEENNYGIRKRLLEYDDVMNSQREVIYKRRKNALLGQRLDLDISNMIFDTIYSILENHADSQEEEVLKSDFLMTFSDEDLIQNIEINQISSHTEKIANNLSQKVQNNYNNKLIRIKDEAFPVIKRIYASKENNYKSILIPFSDGITTINIVCDLDKAIETNGQSIVSSFEKGVMLGSIDKAWKEHLKSMDDLKQSVQGAVYEQKDPLLIYKFESFSLFSNMLDDVNKSILSFLFKSNLPQRDPDQLKNRPIETKFRGQTSRGQEERLPNNGANTSKQGNQPKISRRQRRAQERKMRR